MFKTIVLQFIKLYQKTLSPDHGWFALRYPYGFCRFHPTCSQYAYESVERFGVARGLALALRRVIRCNPFNGPAIDPVPKIF